MLPLNVPIRIGSSPTDGSALYVYSFRTSPLTPHLPARGPKKYFLRFAANMVPKSCNPSVPLWHYKKAYFKHYQQLTDFLTHAEPKSIPAQLKRIDGALSRARYAVEEFIHNVVVTGDLPLRLYPVRTSTTQVGIGCLFLGRIKEGRLLPAP